jgi:transcriptional regulator with GAF, ATPase, and Fis domain
MAKLNESDLIEYIPSLFEINLKSDKSGEDIFNKLRDIFEFDYACIYYLNPESVQLKYTSMNSELIDSVYKPSKKDMEFLYSDKDKILTNKSSIVKSLNIVGAKSFMLQKISVGCTVFGFIVVASNKSDLYTQKDLKVLKSYCAILSYVIKDLELSNVFKIQLKALKDGLIEKNNAYKIIKEQNEFCQQSFMESLLTSKRNIFLILGFQEYIF